jgi:formate dehydrogenase
VRPDVRVIGAPCIGRCEHAPAAVVGRNPIDRATPEAILKAIAGNATEPVAPDCLDYEDYRGAEGYATYLACLRGERAVDDVIRTMEDSSLRGLGGAGFPVGRKWKIVRAEPAPRLMAVNIDEGEPGTFKDRHYLERDPHRFLEGMLIAAWAVGIDDIYIYLRDEYAACRAILARELAALQADPPGPLPRIELRRGAGAYICGEESAMIESIEGRRGMPRLRPPYVAQVGLFGRPTLEHNMETLYWVRDILERGATWFAEQGRHGRKGLRSFSVSGRVVRPGVHLAPAGITVRELIDGVLRRHAARSRILWLSARRRVRRDSSRGDGRHPARFRYPAAARLLHRIGRRHDLSHHDRARDAALNLMRFFADESCGQCTPCRVGTEKAVGLMERDAWDLPLLDELSRAMADASICGLGQAAPNPIACVVKYFPQELE